MYIFICIYKCVSILFALNLKKPTLLYEDVKVIICKAMCISLVKQNVVCSLGVSKMFYSSTI